MAGLGQQGRGSPHGREACCWSFKGVLRHVKLHRGDGDRRHPDDGPNPCRIHAARLPIRRIPPRTNASGTTIISQ